jgi:DNA-binding MarR family transcriptional regulator
MSGNLKSGPNPLPDLGCACANLRRAARLVTQLYSHEIGPEVEPAQFSLLSALHRIPGSSQAPLGRALGLDKTTMSRNLRLMETNRWVELDSTQDRRERRYRLTPAGEKLLAAGKAGWMRAQAKLRAALGTGEWETLSTVFGRVAEAAVAAQQAPGGKSKKGSMIPH